MKKLNKILSVGLSLVMCAGMVTPAFAASFSDLNNAISGNGGTTMTNGRTGYGASLAEDNSKYEIEAWTEDGSRNVQLNADVTYGGEKDAKGITTANFSNVTLNLNGKTIDGGYDAETEEGGSGAPIIKMGYYSTLTINGGVNSEDTTQRGTITGGYSKGDGGAIEAKAESYEPKVTLTVNSVDFIGNCAEGDGGAISTYGSQVNLNDVIMTENRASQGSGGALWTGTRVTVTVTGNTIIVNNSAAGECDDVFQYGGKLTSAEITGLPETVTYKGITYTMVEKKVYNDDYDYDNSDNVDNYTGTMFHYVHECTPGNPVRENVVEPQVGVPGSYDLVVRCPECGEIISSTHVTVPALPAPSTTPSGNGGRVPDSTTSTPVTEPEADATIGIEDEAVPLAGIFTRADAIGYLWEQTGRPEAELSDFPDVPEEHYWAVAIGWAQDMGIALPDEDGNFRPDDMVLRSVEDLEVDPEGELQEFLNRYAVFAGVELDDGELFIELDGAAGDVIMGEEAQEIFNLFFSLLEEALADQAA